MSGYDEPSWVNPDRQGNESTAQEANVGSHVTAPPPPVENYGKKGSNKTLVLMSVINIGLAALMCALGVLTLIEIDKAGDLSDLSEPFLASYMVMFAVLLGIYEIMWWIPMPELNKSIRKNFGFLYGIRGKGFYLIFVACLCLGLGTDARIATLNYITGGCFLASGCLHIFVVCFRPELVILYQAPTAGLGNSADRDESNVV